MGDKKLPSGLGPDSYIRCFNDETIIPGTFIYVGKPPQKVYTSRITSDFLCDPKRTEDKDVPIREAIPEKTYWEAGKKFIDLG